MKKYFENKTNSPMYVSGVMVPAGEGAMVDVPHEDTSASAEAAPTLAEQVALMLRDSVAKIVASLGELNADALDMVEALEGSAAKPRTSLLSAVADERIKRADAALKTDAL